MHIPWTGSKCIICLKEASLSEEHLIPAALGGKLTCTFLCKRCNSTLGSSFEAKARMDPSVQIATDRLGAQIPELAMRISNNQPILLQGPGGQERGRIRKNKASVRARRVNEESYIQSTADARVSVKKILQQSAIGEAPLAAALRMFDEIPENQRVTLIPGLDVAKWAVDQVDLDLRNNRLMSPLVPLKIGFEFLACHLGTSIYDEASQMQELRTSLRESIEDHPCFEVERLAGSDFRPFHGVFFEGNAPYARILIILFGWIVFRVHFPKLAVNGQRFVYTHFLDAGIENIKSLQPLGRDRAI